MGDTGGMNQGHKSAGQFCTKKVNSNEFLQISRDYEIENIHHRQNFW